MKEKPVPNLCIDPLYNVCHIELKKTFRVPFREQYRNANCTVFKPHL